MRQILAVICVLVPMLLGVGFIFWHVLVPLCQALGPRTRKGWVFLIALLVLGAMFQWGMHVLFPRFL